MSEEHHKETSEDIEETPSMILIVAFASYAGICLILSFGFAFGSISLVDYILFTLPLSLVFVSIVICLHLFDKYVKNKDTTH